MNWIFNNIPTIVALIVGLILLACTVFTVDQKHVGVIQRFGKFVRLAHPGLNAKIPFIESIVDEVNLRVQQLAVDVETKTSDNVFVKVQVAVQYFIKPDKVYEAYYNLDDAEEQMESFVFDVVRAKVPAMKLDEVFDKKDEVGDAIKKELAETMSGFGYEIFKALVTDVEPDESVKAAMNSINAAQREQVAATAKGEAEKVLMVKRAEAEAESKKLQGEGTANQRKAIVDGLRASVADFQKAVDGVSAGEVLNLVLVTQYLDTLRDIGSQSKSNTVFLPHSPGAVTDLSQQIRDGMMQANAVQS